MTGTSLETGVTGSIDASGSSSGVNDDDGGGVVPDEVWLLDGDVELVGGCVVEGCVVGAGLVGAGSAGGVDGRH